jgi:hypothetical protein
MSRHDIPGNDPCVVATVGWDTQMQSFFAAVIRSPDPDDREAEPETLLWVGQTQCGILTSEAQALALTPYVTLSAETLT